MWKGRKAKAAIPGGISMGLLSEAGVRHAARLRRAGRGRLPGTGHRRGRRARRDGAAWSTFCTTVAASSSTKVAASVRPAAKERAWALEMLDRIKAGKGRLKDLDLLLEIGDTIGHHSRHDDLRPGRRRRLADQERHPQVPRRIRRLHQAHESDRLYGDRGGAGAGGSVRVLTNDERRVMNDERQSGHEFGRSHKRLCITGDPFVFRVAEDNARASDWQADVAQWDIRWAQYRERDGQEVGRSSSAKHKPRFRKLKRPPTG